jgi:fumarate reductase subunit D
MTSISAYARAAVVAGLAGNLAISAYLAIALPLFFHTKPLLLFQWDASNIVGSSAYAGGFWSALLGFAFDCIVAICWAAIFAALYQTVPAVRRSPPVAGMLFGIVVMLVMIDIVVPLRRAQHAAQHAATLLNTAVAHVVFFGLPVALTVAAVLASERSGPPGERL